jgi:mRNA interferase MazF
VVITQGDVWWADLPEPRGSAPGYRRPVVVVQSDEFNRSSLRTVICVPLTSNRKWAALPGNVELTRRDTGLRDTSVANVTQLLTLDRNDLTEHVGRLTPGKIDLLLGGIEIILGKAS